MDISKFMITDKQYLKISHDTLPIEILRDALGYSIAWTCVNVAYVNEEKNSNILVGYYETGSFSNKMATSFLLEKVLEGSAVYDENVYGDIGVSCNEYRQETIDFFPGKNSSFLNQYDRKTGTEIESWLYNDKDGNIIFEITPLYFWIDPDLRKDPMWISYKKFMKNYKPIVKTIISPKNIKQWIKQGKELKKLWFYE